MIPKAYFKRQATTLRKLVRITGNQTIANRLSFMADDFEHRSVEALDQLETPTGHPVRAADGENGTD